jgi:hypothetical protein
VSDGDVRPEPFRVGLSESAVGSVGRDDHVRVEFARADDVGIELEFDTDVRRAFRQEVKQRGAGDAVSAALVLDAFAVKDEMLALPSPRPLSDELGCFGIGAVQVGEQIVPEHDAPPVAALWWLAFEHGDVMMLVGLFHQDREIQTGRSTTHAHDAHHFAPPRDTSGQRCPHRRESAFPADRQHDMFVAIGGGSRI